MPRPKASATFLLGHRTLAVYKFEQAIQTFLEKAAKVGMGAAGCGYYSGEISGDSRGGYRDSLPYSPFSTTHRVAMDDTMHDLI